MLRRLWPFLITAAIVGLCWLVSTLPEDAPGARVFERLEWLTYDWRLRQATQFPRPATDKLGFVFISDESIAVFSEGALGPAFKFSLYWPRHIYGRVIQELKAQGAKVVGLDILFTDRQTDRVPVQTAQGPMDSDLYFQHALEQAGNVVLGASPGATPHPLFRRSAWGLGDISTSVDSDGVLRRVHAFRDYRIWDPLIQREARLNGWNLAAAQVSSNYLLFPAPEGKLARLELTPEGYFDPTQLTGRPASGGLVRLRKAYEDMRVWHMGVVLAACELGANLDQAMVELDQGRITLFATNGQIRIIPVDASGRLYIDWTMPLNDPRITKEAFEQLVAKSILRQLGTNVTPRFKDKLVIIGSTATGNDLTDRGVTPLEPDTFLTSNHFNVANSIITGRFIRRAPGYVTWLVIAGLCGIGAILTLRLRQGGVASLAIAVLAGIYAWATVFVFVQDRYWLPLVLPLFGLVLTHVGLVSYQVVFEQAERRRIRQVFSKIVSPSVVNELLQAERLSLVGARREVTVMFADVRGFTEMTDLAQARAEETARAQNLDGAAAEAWFDAQAQELLQTVNLYLGQVADIVIRHHGTLDKYIGDCVMAFWGAPTFNEHHARDCVLAAIEAQRAIRRLNQRRSAENQRRQVENQRRLERGELPLPLLEELHLGTGINTGTVTVGLMGSDAHIVNYTVFGREVNLASRLESLSGRGRILIGEATYRALCRDMPELAATCKELPPVTVKGIRHPVQVFEVPWREEETSILTTNNPSGPANGTASQADTRAA